MSLPKVITPEYKIKLPSSKKTITYRPFLAKEEKILLMALEDKNINVESITTAVFQILKNCILTRNVNIEELSSIDIEYLFINLRMKSAGENVEINFNIKELFECSDETCPGSVKVKIDLNKIEVKNLHDQPVKIMLDERTGVVLKYPTISVLKENEEKNTTEAIFELISNMIEQIFNEDEVTYIKDLSKEDLKELPKWIENSFTTDKLNEIMNFLKEQPYTFTLMKVKCPKCQKVKETEVKGLVDFFT